jgi:hypothetical protein
MRTIVLAAALILSPAAAMAAGDVMSGYYGNTVITRTNQGESHIHYRADHKFDGSAHNTVGSMDLTGSWTIDDEGQLCRTYDTPPPGITNPSCSPIAAHSPGETWSDSVDGQTRALTLAPGIQ